MTRQEQARGLVLSELVLAILIAGLLAVGIAVQLGGAVTSNAQALALYNITQKMAANWGQIAGTCGATSAINGSPFLASGSQATDVFTKGAQAIDPRFLPCYNQSKVRLLTDAIQVTAAGPQIQQYAFTLSGGGIQPFIAQFSQVPADVTYALATHYGDLTAPNLLAQDLNDPHVRYWPDNQKTYTVQLLVGQPTQLVATASTPGGTTPASFVAPPAATGISSSPAGVTPPTTLSPPPLGTPQPLAASGGSPPAGSGTSGSGSGSGGTSGNGSGGGNGSGSGTGSGGGSGSGSGNGPGGGSGSGYPPLPDLPAKPQSLNMPCSGGWNGVQEKTFDDGNGHVTVFYAGYDMSGLTGFSYASDYSSVTPTGGPVTATAKGTASGNSGNLTLCVAERSYSWDTTNNAWSYTSWALTYSSIGNSSGQLCLTGYTNSGNGNATANTSSC